MVSGFEFDEMDMISSMHVHEDQMKKTYKPAELIKDLFQTLYLIFDYPYKYYTFKHFEV